MSDQQAEIEAEPDESTADQPDMSGDMADVDGLEDIEGLADDIENEAGQPGENAASGGEDLFDGDMAGDGVTVGEIYCRGLTILANGAMNQYGENENKFVEADGDIDITLAQQLKLDVYVNQLMAERGGMENMPPGQALVVSTGLFAIAVMSMDPGLTNTAFAKARDR